MPPLSLEDLGVVRWQPPEDAATSLTTPLTPADRRRRQIRRAIETTPDASDRKVAEIPGCDHEAVTAYRRNQGGFPAIDADPQPAVSSDHSPAQVCAHPRDPTQLCVDVSVCRVCGAVVRDRQVHADWHA